mgnify:CR=1 FL=1
MKKTLVLLSVGVWSASAALVHFDLSPAGTDAAVGLTPANEVPAVTNSTGSGGKISGGIVFDTETYMLQLAVGYGSAPGFTDLTGVPTAMHIHGPAGASQNAPPLVNLLPYHYTAAPPAQGGVIFGEIPFPTNSVADLLAGLTYLNIHTAINPAGEVRAQLVPRVATNSPPAVSCAPDSEIECGDAAELTVAVSDPDGDALTVIWTVNGTAMQTNTLPASDPPVAANVSFTCSLPLGTNVVGVTVIDSAAHSTSCSTTVTVVDTQAPVITAARAEPNVLWPPNRQFVDVRLRARVQDACGPTGWKIIRVRSNESPNIVGAGNTARDWRVTGDHTVKLRAERSGTGNGRVYYITIQAQDAAGNKSETRTVNVIVPKSQGKKPYILPQDPDWDDEKTHPGQPRKK